MKSSLTDEGQSPKEIRRSCVCAHVRDPYNMLSILAAKKNKEDKLYMVSLGQGQAEFAERTIAEGRSEGAWVFIANCHYLPSWMPSLSNIVNSLRTERSHPEFRLWLSSAPNSEFPLSVLQNSLKLTTQRPKGIKIQMMAAMSKVSDEYFQQCRLPEEFQKLYVALAFFHSLVNERSRFLTLGWSSKYNFTDDDFEMSARLILMYLNSNDQVPWETLRYLIGSINYSGHIVDEWDRRLLFTYLNELFCEDLLLNVEGFK
ncbi:DNAH2 [Cordylochernes scorpioides]|uniref:DNAH2 n=1 Tax=Cordylochernes scorpioides TaxID=51811 RepID=A0ABY6LT66_9ARAC|nr:DNAH2 [Cordylochernes scorpioides]